MAHVRNAVAHACRLECDGRIFQVLFGRFDGDPTVAE
jgi:hypothetical protein